MALVDALETQLASTPTTADKLMDTIVVELTTSNRQGCLDAITDHCRRH
jgi:hypothetical protein